MVGAATARAGGPTPRLLAAAAWARVTAWGEQSGQHADRTSLELMRPSSITQCWSVAQVRALSLNTIRQEPSTHAAFTSSENGAHLRSGQLMPMEAHWSSSART